MFFRDLENTFRYRRVVRNPWQAARARASGKEGDLVPLQLRGGGVLWIRSQTSDFRVFKDVFVKDVYRLRALEARCRSHGRFECVVDIGGHIGVFAARAAVLARQLISCEPFPANAALFRRNLESLELANVHLLERAVSSSAGRLPLYTSWSTARHTAVPSMAHRDAPSETVEATTLAKVLESFSVDRCDLLKLDCEGGEYEVLFHASDEILGRVDRIAMEYHNPGAECPRSTGAELENHLRKRGFAVERLASRRHANYGLLFAWRGATWT